MIKQNLIYHETKNKNGILRIENFISDSNFLKENINFNFDNKFTNKGIIYGFFFNFFFLLFLYSFI
jgi:ABC-type multidrug transport system permease subunit